jgi:hypothetical protein
MKRTILCLLVTLGLIACASKTSGTSTNPVSTTPGINAKKDTNMTVIKNYEDLKANIGKDVILEGIMKMEKFVDKRNRVHEFYEFWLEMNDGHQVKLRNAGEAMSKEPFTHKVHIEGNLFYGNIDSSNPEAQSRVAYRLDFTKVTIVERR